MTKSTITRTWIAGLVVLAAGLVLAGVAIFLMLAYGGTFTQTSTNSYDFVPNLDSYFWMTVGLIIAGGILAGVGGIVQLAAWIGALVNTYRLQDKTWFTILVLGGVFGLVFGLVGFAVMVAYVIAGPEGMSLRQPQFPTPAKPTALAPTS